MKSFILAIAVILSPLASLACPGGHLKSLSVKGQELAQINMTDSSLHITDGSSKIIAVSTIKSGAYEPRELCGQSRECDSSEVLDIDVLQDPQAVIVIHIRQANANSSQIFKVSNFTQSRSANACGQVIQPLR